MARISQDILLNIYLYIVTCLPHGKDRTPPPSASAPAWVMPLHLLLHPQDLRPACVGVDKLGTFVILCGYF